MLCFLPRTSVGLVYQCCLMVVSGLVVAGVFVAIVSVDNVQIHPTEVDAGMVV